MQGACSRTIIPEILVASFYESDTVIDEECQRRVKNNNQYKVDIVKNEEELKNGIAKGKHHQEVIYIALTYDKANMMNKVSHLEESGDPCWRLLICHRIPHLHGREENEEEIKRNCRIDELIDADTGEEFFTKLKVIIDKSLGLHLATHVQKTLTEYLLPAVAKKYEKQFYKYSKPVFEETMRLERQITISAKQNAAQYVSGVTHMIVKLENEAIYGVVPCVPNHPLTPFIMQLPDIENPDCLILPNRSINHNLNLPIFRWSVIIQLPIGIHQFLLGGSIKIICKPRESVLIEDAFRRGEKKFVFAFKDKSHLPVGHVPPPKLPQNRKSLKRLGNVIEIDFTNFRLNREHLLVRELVTAGNVVDLPAWFEKCPTNIFSSYFLKVEDVFFKHFQSLFSQHCSRATIFSIKMLQHLTNYCAYCVFRDYLNGKYPSGLADLSIDFLFYASGSYVPKEIILGTFLDILAAEESKRDAVSKVKMGATISDNGIHLSLEPNYADRYAYVCKVNDNQLVDKKQILACCVATGKIEQFAANQRFEFPQPYQCAPSFYIPDSIKAWSLEEQANIFCVFNPKQIYPAFIIEYTVPKN